MKLSDFLAGLSYEVLQGDIDIKIDKIEYDSRKVEKDSAFVCIEGFQTDGHKYALSACEKGASAIICQKTVDNIPENITVLKSDDTRKMLALLGCAFYANPSQKLNMIGITGTNGKTTVTYLIKSVLDKIGHKVGVIGTIENLIGDKILHTSRTTPESLDLQELLQQMELHHCDDVVMEVSSHALDLNRVYGVEYAIGVFTNLTQDHLDYHKTMENYKIAKGLLFAACHNSVINVDDAAGEYMLEVSKGNVITYAINNTADLQAENVKITADGVNFILDYKNNTYPVVLNTPGKFSIYNALAAIGTCLLMKIDMETILSGLKAVPGVHGRFQTIKSRQGVNAIVDYAHTPDGLENILSTAREFAEGRIITVFGCGGDRDRTKRPIMGEIAGRLSDFCIITSDNPRTEEPQQILNDVEPGCQKSGCKYSKIIDRRKAIEFAIAMSKPKDLVVVAGKGHEDYQIFADKTIHFDDVEEVKRAFGEDLK